MAKSGMRAFWDRRAKENAYFFVDDRMYYRQPDLARFWEWGREDLDGLLGALGVSLSPGDSVVEIGCGVGRVTRWIAPRVRRVRALDISERMLELAREHNAERLSNVEWLLGDGTSLSPIEDAGADVCISHVVFQHIPDPAVILGYVREMGRVLRPGGWAAFQLSNDRTAGRRWKRGMRWRLRVLAGRAPRGQDHPAWLGSAVDLQELERTATQAGLTLERVLGEGTRFCSVLARQRSGGPAPEAGAGEQ